MRSAQRTGLHSLHSNEFQKFRLFFPPFFSFFGKQRASAAVGTTRVGGPPALLSTNVVPLPEEVAESDLLTKTKKQILRGAQETQIRAALQELL